MLADARSRQSLRVLPNRASGASLIWRPASVPAVQPRGGDAQAAARQAELRPRLSAHIDVAEGVIRIYKAARRLSCMFPAELIGQGQRFSTSQSLLKP